MLACWSKDAWICTAGFVDEWFRSGDLGSRDADGYLFVTGRLKEIINRGGEKMSPGDINAVLLSNPKMLEAESFGESDAIYGEKVQAVVILHPKWKQLRVSWATTAAGSLAPSKFPNGST